MSPSATTAAGGAATPLITPELVRLDAPAGPEKKDVIEYLADVVASAGRADTPEGLATDALAREATAPTGIPGGIAIPHCRSPHVLAPSLGFARLASGVDFGAADGAPADLVFMIAAPAGADDLHLQLLAKLARGLMRSEFTDALRAASTPEEVARYLGNSGTFRAGSATSPWSSSTALATRATSMIWVHSMPGTGSRSTRSSSGWSRSLARIGCGLRSMQPRLATQASPAGSSSTISLADRPDGKFSSTVCSHSGRFSGARF